MTATPAPPERDRAEAQDDPVRVVERRGRRTALTSEGRNTDRIVFFSDAVFAIALTLLVLDIRIPEVPDDALAGALADVVPHLLAYCISFAVIAITWLTHFKRFRLMTGYDAWTIRLNFVLLFFVCLIPFPTSVFAQHPTSWGTALYGASLAAIFCVQSASWVHARRAGLIAPVVDHRMYARTRDSLGLIAAVFLVSLPMAAVRPGLAWLTWSLLTPVVPFFAGWWNARAGRSTD